MGNSLGAVACAMSAVFVVVGATPAYAWPHFSAPVHQALVFLHIFGAIIFMGNIVVSAMWMTHAKRTRNTDVLHFAATGVMRADWVFTLPGALLILVPGLLAVGPHGGFPGATWAELALALFIVSGIIWTVILIPLQRRMVQMTSEAVSLNIGLTDRFYVVLKRWSMWGGIATLLPLVALYLMVYKPSLWG
jgi:uncharacterized membrane protein